ncbi:MAG: UDP-N-acetylmuramoyl-L-alanine--D-glutamate ligase [Candidatus Eremiobacteraeota bacterium]|nr:UDP-N-acetylmuramoyl-L-alanine--D-glutamate ligase [Candidatus Eremiobacteraeota bacterium]
MSDGFQFGAGETILIIGLGRSGLASIEVLAEHRVTLYATDEKPIAELTEPINAASAFGARFVAPADLGTIVDRLNCAVLSPGVPPTSPVVRRMHEANVPVFGEIELAYRLCEAPIVAVTGTKGKSTTTALIGHLLRSCGATVHVGGNIGNPLIKEVRGAGEHDWIVAEVSSFQLETIRAFKPRVAVLLNIAPDHLDRYHSMDEYAEAKFRICANQSMSDWFVGNLDDPRIRALHWHHGDARVQARQLWFTLERPDQATMYLRDGVITYAPVSGDPRPIPIMRREEIPLAGEHNVQNAMAALLAALAVGCKAESLRDAMRSFQPMAHRLHIVAEVDGVRYIDDSKSTNPGSVIAALRTYDAPIVLIAGGRSKGTDFSGMGAEIRRRASALVAIGESAPEIARAARGVRSIVADSMDDAVRRASDLAVPGGIVLLSPGCASFDMFASAEERGDRFAAAVQALREPAGA